MVPAGQQPAHLYPHRTRERLILDRKSDRREFRALTGGVIHASGGPGKYAIPFLFEKIAPGTFKVKLSDLKRGEYGFLPPLLLKIASMLG